MPRPNQLSEAQVRVTVRLPEALYEEFVGWERRYHHTGSTSLSAMFRKAIVHYLACPDLRRAEAEAQAAFEVQVARIEQAMMAKEERKRARRP